MMHPSQCIIPNTLDQALQPCPQREARSIICVRPNDGHTTLFVNDTWTSLTGLSQFASEGRPLMEMLPVHPAFHHQIKMLCRYCEAGIAGSRIMVLLHPGQTQQQPQGRMIGDDINTTTRSHSVVYVRVSGTPHELILILILILTLKPRDRLPNLTFATVTRCFRCHPPVPRLPHTCWWFCCP